MNNRYILTGLAIVAVLVGGILFLRKANPVPVVHKTAGEEVKAKGPEDAPIQISEYSDFQCPACQRAQVPMKRLYDTYAGKVRIEYHHYPLQMHRWSRVAHQAAECANKYGKFWEYHDKLFAEQKTWSEMPNPAEAFIEYAKGMGINIDDFGKCMADQSIADKIEKERSRGDYLQVKSTPTFFLNGERLVGAIDLEVKGEEMIRLKLGLPALPKPAAPAVPAVPAGTPPPAIPASPSSAGTAASPASNTASGAPAQS